MTEPGEEFPGIPTVTGTVGTTVEAHPRTEVGHALTTDREEATGTTTEETREVPVTAGMITEDPAEAASTPTVTTSGRAAVGLGGQRTLPNPGGMTVPDFDYNLIYFTIF